MKTKLILISVLSFILHACNDNSPTQNNNTTPSTATPSSPSLTLEEKIQDINTFLADQHQQQKFNGAILIAKDHNPLLIAAHGFSDHTKSGILTVNSSFRLASVSKQFTCMAIMILQERGLLEYSDLLSTHIPELNYADITIEHLMHHTSGLENYTSFPESHITEQGAQFMTMPVFFDIIADHPLDLQFPPGSEWRYSNTGYILLAEIISRVSGQTFEDFLHNEIFSVLDMQDSDVWNLQSDPNSLRLPNRTYGFSGDQDFSSSYFDGVAGDGAIFSSVADLLKWDQALSNHSLVSEDTMNRAFTPATLPSQLTDYASGGGYGYGWIIGKSNNQDFAWHSGSWLGASTFIFRNITTKSVIVLLDNSNNPEFGTLLDYIIAKLEDENLF